MRTKGSLKILGRPEGVHSEALQRRRACREDSNAQRTPRNDSFGLDAKVVRRVTYSNRTFIGEPREEVVAP